MNKYKIGDCLYWKNILGKSYVFKIVNIYDEVRYDRRHTYYVFEVLYGIMGTVPTRTFQDNSSVCADSKLLPKDWDESTILAMVI